MFLCENYILYPFSFFDIMFCFVEYINDLVRTSDSELSRKILNTQTKLMIIFSNSQIICKAKGKK